MNSPQDRVIKKMIDNIVEGNKPHFEHHDRQSDPHEPSQPRAAALVTETEIVLSRKVEYGFATMGREHAEMRKLIEDLSGTLKLLRSDVEMLRSTVNQRMRESVVAQAAPKEAAPATQSSSSSSVGAPQYRKSDADAAFEQESGTASHAHGDPVPPNEHAARGSKKDSHDVDLGKVFYYGKK